MRLNENLAYTELATGTYRAVKVAPLGPFSALFEG